MSFPGVFLAGVVLAVLLSLVRPVRADELPPLTGFLLGGRVDAGIDVSP